MTNLWTVLYFTLGITLTGLMLVLFKRLFRDKLSARWHYLVWLVLLVRAILPENLRLFSTGFALNTLWISGMKRLRAAVELGRNSLLSTPFGMGGGEISLLKKMPFSAWSLTDRLFAVYLAGVAAVLLYDALLYARLRLEIRKGAAATPSLREKIRKTAEKYDLPTQKSVRICKGIETPFLCGMVRPILVVPESMAETIDEKVLLHEMLHLKHHDVLVNFLLHLLQALNWFNPFVYWLCRIIRNDSEALCDQRALEKLRGEEKREYGMLLLDMADSRCASRIGTTSMANGARNIKTRIGRIADFGRVPKGAAFATACITVVLCLASVSFAYQPQYFDTSKVETAEDLRLTLEDARLFEIPSAEMAISIFYEAFEERDLAKLALTVPEEEFDTYRDWALAEYKAAEDTYHARLDSGTKADYTYRFYDSMEMEDFYLLDYNKLYIHDLLCTYFDEIMELIAWGKFDSLTHLTYPLRYIVGEQHREVSYDVYKDRVDDILKALIEQNKALELNTSGLRQAIGKTMPCPTVIKRFKELGGKYLTIGSDAHRWADIGSGVEEGYQIAQSAGFDHITIFVNREPVLLPLE